LKQESYHRIFPEKTLFPKKKRKNYFVLNALIPLLHAGAFPYARPPPTEGDL
jgi:hypothetical protein